MKKAQQRPYFFILLKRNNLKKTLLVAFNHSAIDSILTYCLMVWYADSTAVDKKSLQQVIWSAEKIISCSLPSLDDIASSRHLGRDKNIIKNSTHPGHEQFQLLPSGRHHRSAKTCTSRFKDYFFPRAIRALNSHINNNYLPPIMIVLALNIIIFIT